MQTVGRQLVNFSSKALAAAATAAIEFLASEQGETRRKNASETDLRKQLAETGADFGNSGAAIISWIVGDEERALDLSRALLREGFLVPAILYPTVPKGAARLPVTVSASHCEAQIAKLGDAIRHRSAGDYGPVAAEARKSGVGT